jgi:hypothetical protein
VGLAEQVVVVEGLLVLGEALDLLVRGGREVVVRLVGGGRLGVEIGLLRLAASRSERLLLQALHLPGVGSAATFELEVLADGVVEQSHPSEP